MKFSLFAAALLVTLSARAVDTEKVVNLARLSTTHTTMKLVNDLAVGRGVKSPFSAQELAEMKLEAAEASAELEALLSALRTQGPRDCFTATSVLVRHAQGDGLAFGLATADFLSQGSVLQDASKLVTQLRTASQETVEVLAAKIDQRCR